MSTRRKAAKGRLYHGVLSDWARLMESVRTTANVRVAGAQLVADVTVALAAKHERLGFVPDGEEDIPARIEAALGEMLAEQEAVRREIGDRMRGRDA